MSGLAIFLLVWFGTSALALSGPLWWTPVTTWISETLRPDAFATEDALADVLIALIEEHPDEWALDGRRLSHAKSGMSVWIANAYSGLPYLKINAGGADLKPSYRKRRDIYAAYKDLAARRDRAAVARAVGSVRDRLRVYEGGRP